MWGEKNRENVKKIENWWFKRINNNENEEEKLSKAIVDEMRWGKSSVIIIFLVDNLQHSLQQQQHYDWGMRMKWKKYFHTICKNKQSFPIEEI